MVLFSSGLPEHLVQSLRFSAIRARILMASFSSLLLPFLACTSEKKLMAEVPMQATIKTYNDVTGKQTNQSKNTKVGSVSSE